jgi:hypothetical protein
MMTAIYMPPDEFRRIRTKSGMSLKKTAATLRISDLGSVHRWEKGTRPISGPVSILMEMIDRGELPSRFYSETVSAICPACTPPGEIGWNDLIDDRVDLCDAHTVIPSMQI